MGKDKKADPAKAAAKKARNEAKQQKIINKRNKKELKESGEEDIESIIAEFQERDRQRTAVTITVTPQPSPRKMLLFGGEFCDGESTCVYNDVYRWNLDRNEWKLIESLNTPPPRCSHQAVFHKDQIYIFGGEYATLDQFHHYRDMWALDIKTNIWREIPPKGDVPSPRSGHRMLVWRNYLVLFGGFYEALKEVRWYNDLYLFSFQEERWILIPPRAYMPLPKPRSGFVMMLHPAEDSVFIFGGYSKEKNTSKKSEGKIHTDMWMLNLRGILPSSGAGGAGISRLDVSKASWQKISNKGTPPSPRCGASMITYKNKGIYFGGVFDDEGPRHTIQSSFYNDLYAFDFERKRWYELGVKHASALATGKKKRRKAKEKTTENENEQEESSEEEVDEDEVEDGEIQEDALHNQNQENLFGYIDDSGNIVYVNIDSDDFGEVDIAMVDDAPPATSIQDDWINVGVSPPAPPHDSVEVLVEKLDISEAPIPVPQENKPQLTQSEILQAAFLEEELRETSQQIPSDSNPLVQFFNNYTNTPVGRINCQLVTKGCTLYVYGGVTEYGDVEITLDDCWSLDLNKRDKWKCVLKGNMTDLVWKGNEGDDQSERTGEGDSDRDDDDDSDGDDSEEDENDLEDDEAGKKLKKKSSKKSSEEVNDPDVHDDDVGKKSKKSKSKSSRAGIRGEMDELRAQLPGGGEDANRIPLTGAAVPPSTHKAPPNKKGTTTGPEIESLRDFYSRTTPYWKEYAIEMWQKGAVNLDGVLQPPPPSDEGTGAAVISAEDALNLSYEHVQVPRSSEPLAEKELKRIAFSLCQYHYDEILPIVTRLAELEESVGESENGGEGKGKSGGGSRGKSSRKG